jgi:hypothetical protein
VSNPTALIAVAAAARILHPVVLRIPVSLRFDPTKVDVMERCARAASGVSPSMCSVEQERVLARSYQSVTISLE